MAYKVQTKIKADGMPGKTWRDFSLFNRTFETEQQAWDWVGTLDEYGCIDRVSYRVVPVA